MFKLFRKKKIQLFAPLTGEVTSVTNVPDMVFSEKMLGDGVAIQPSDGMVVAPCNGKVVQIFPTNHAIGIETKEELDILIHLGVDTVELEGEAFERIGEEGQEVTVGMPLLRMDLNKIKKLGKPIISPIIVTTMDRVQKMETVSGNVQGGKDIIITIELK